jgi:hypothetical protein
MPRSFFLAEDYTFSKTPPLAAAAAAAAAADAEGFSVDMRQQQLQQVRQQQLGDVGGDGPVLGCFNSLYKVTCDV